jgi:hypothetical protein|tara:strand:- start:1379 stop:1549 length:171 start_codon:yes stop_codon:yes gene_type:complete
MGKVKNLLMDMEEAVNDAVASGCSNLEMVITHCEDNLSIMDEDFIKEYYESQEGEL